MNHPNPFDPDDTASPKGMYLSTSSPIMAVAARAAEMRKKQERRRARKAAEKRWSEP